MAKVVDRVLRSGMASEADGDEPEGAGWLWDDPRESEERFRDYIRNVELTVRGMVGDPEVVGSKLKELRLVIVDMARVGFRSAGRPVPDFLQAVENEIIKGEFR